MSAKRERPLVNSARPMGVWHRIVFLLAVLALWWCCARQGWVSTLIVPAPESVWTAAINIGPDLWIHAGATFLRGAGGFVVGAVFGVILGAGVQFSQAVRYSFEPALDASRPVPAVALLPFFILIFGFSETGRGVLIVLNVTVFIALATAEALARIPEAWTRYARVAGMRRAEIFRRILLPGATPWLSGPFRLALALSFTLAIAAEFMGAQTGLGFLINTARVNLATPTIWLAVLMIGLVCQLADQVLVRVFNRLTAWYQTTDRT